MSALFQSRPDGEYRQCRRCMKLGYDVDSWHPATSEFWPMVHGRLWFGRCLACAGELASHKHGFVPAREAA